MLSVPYPDQIVEMILARKFLKHQVPQPLIGFGTRRAPPEPAAAGLVQGAPEHRDPGVAQASQLNGNGVQVLHEQFIALRILAVHDFFQIDRGILSIEAGIPPFLLQIG